jgi:hypothetical protein
MTERSNIPLHEEFDLNAWINYDAYDEETRQHFPYQRHVDIRTFMADSNERWSEGIFGFQPTVAQYPALKLDTTEELTFLESATPDHPLDLETDFSDSDYITFSLPDFPLAEIETNQSRIELTSDPEGHCSNASVTASMTFKASLDALIEGSCKFRVLRSAFQQNEIDLSKITGIRFRIVANEPTSLIIMGLKLVLAPTAKPGWVVSTVDFDNWNGRLRKPTPLDGNVSSGPLFIQSTLWRASPLPGINDPTPIDTEFGVAFNTGSALHDNNITLFFREESMIFQNQLDLIGVTMSDLDGKPQPDLGTVEFLPRTVGEFDKRPMEQFDHLETMEDLERIAVENPVEQSWVFFTLKWDAVKTSITMANSTSPGYVFPKLPEPLDSNANYLLVASLAGSTARLRIYRLNNDKTVIQEPIFDSTVIDDDGIFRRRKGRVGWQATLGDADAYVQNIRPRSVCFAEYESAPLESRTPVDGAQLFASFTGNEELWDQGFKQYPAESKALRLTRDKSRTTSGESFRVDTDGTTNNVGLETNLFEVIDFSQFEIRFNLWFAGEPRQVERVETVHAPTLPSPHLFPPFFPSKGYTSIDEVMESNIIANFVSDQGVVYRLGIPELETNQWQEVILRIPDNLILQTGRYALQILQPTKVASTWWVDSVSIFERAVQWSARSVVDDPWKSNYAPWTDFREIVNVNRKGILLSPRGKELQLRGRALRQNATIRSPKIIPRYAQLGRLVFPEEKLTGKIGPTAKLIINGTNPSTFEFIDESTDGTASIISREWLFGDGAIEAGDSTVVEHRYTQEGTYHATLVVTDRNGLRSESTETIVVV